MGMTSGLLGLLLTETACLGAPFDSETLEELILQLVESWTNRKRGEENVEM
jgi:hypothetical protein